MAVTISLSGKNAIVTGAGKGIGAATALRLAQAGANVALVGRTEANLLQTQAFIAAETNVKTMVIPVDLSHSEQIPPAVARAIDELGSVDILVNNAAVNFRETAFNVEMDHWDAVYNTNLKGYFLMAREAARNMIENGGGSIVNIGSELSFVGLPEGQVAYSTSKAAINQLTRVLAAEWAPKHIRVNTVIPSLTETPLIAESLKKPGYREKFEKDIPLGRLAMPDDIANAVLFMASDMAGFTTGETLLADGGFTNIRK